MIRGICPLGLGVGLGASVRTVVFGEAGPTRAPNDGARECGRLVEETIIMMGQAHSAILYNCRKNVLVKFVRDNAKAGSLVSQNQEVLSSTPGTVW